MKLTKSQFKQLLKEEITNVLETHGLEQAAQAMATAGAYELPPQAMQRLMRVINQTSVKLTDEETIELANALIGADMLKTAAEAPEEVGLEEIVKEALRGISTLSPEEQEAVGQEMDVGIAREYAQDVVNHVREKIASQEAPAMAGITMGEFLRMAADLAGDEPMAPWQAAARRQK